MSAVVERADPHDGFIDAVLAWERVEVASSTRHPVCFVPEWFRRSGDIPGIIYTSRRRSTAFVAGCDDIPQGHTFHRDAGTYPAGQASGTLDAMNRGRTWTPLEYAPHAPEGSPPCA